MHYFLCFHQILIKKVFLHKKDSYLRSVVDENGYYNYEYGNVLAEKVVRYKKSF